MHDLCRRRRSYATGTPSASTSPDDFGKLILDQLIRARENFCLPRLCVQNGCRSLKAVVRAWQFAVAGLPAAPPVRLSAGDTTSGSS